MTSTLHRTLAAALLTGLVVAPAGAASAQSLLDTDQQSDVRSFTGDSKTSVAEPAETNGDILSTRFTHGKYRIGVRMQFADLQKSGLVRGEYLRIVTNEGLRREVSLIAAPGFWGGKAEMDTPGGKRVRCAVRHSVDYTHHVVTLGFPRSCVSNPRWVRLGLGSVRAETQDTFYLDDALIDGNVNPDTVRLSTRLKRG